MASHAATSGRIESPQSHPRNQLLHYVARYKWHYAGGLIALVVASFLTMLPPVILRIAIDDLAEGTTRSRLVTLGGLVVMIAIVESGKIGRAHV